MGSASCLHPLFDRDLLSSVPPHFHRTPLAQGMDQRLMELGQQHAGLQERLDQVDSALQVPNLRPTTHWTPQNLGARAACGGAFITLLAMSTLPPPHHRVSFCKSSDVNVEPESPSFLGLGPQSQFATSAPPSGPRRRGGAQPRARWRRNGGWQPWRRRARSHVIA